MILGALFFILGLWALFTLFVLFVVNRKVPSQVNGVRKMLNTSVSGRTKRLLRWLEAKLGG